MPASSQLLNDDLSISTRITATLTLPADALDSSCGNLFFVPSHTVTVGIGALHFLRAPIDYQASSSAVAIYGMMNTELAMTRR